MRPKRVRLLVWWQFPRGSRPGSSARAGASWEPQFFDQDSLGSAPTMPSHQWAVSALIREVLADPDLAGRASSAACSGPGRTGPVGVRGRRRDRRAAPRRAPRSASTGATARGPRPWPPPPGRSSSRSPSCARARSSPPCSTPAGGWTRPRCAVICSARSRGRLHPQEVDDLVRALGNESGISRSTVSRIRDGHRRGGQGVPVPPPGPHLVPLPVRRAPPTST